MKVQVLDLLIFTSGGDKNLFFLQRIIIYNTCIFWGGGWGVLSRIVQVLIFTRWEFSLFGLFSWSYNVW